MFEQQFSSRGLHDIVASESQELSAAERDRDIFDSHRHRVFAVAYYMTSNEIEAEEILTQTFVKVFTDQSPADGHRVDQALIGELEQRFELEPAEGAVPDAALLLARTATHRTAMEEALGELPPLERLLFLLKNVEGYPAAKIATLVDLPEAEVQRTIFSGRIRMRNALALAQKRKEQCEQEQPAGEAV